MKSSPTSFAISANSIGLCAAILTVCLISVSGAAQTQAPAAPQAPAVKPPDAPTAAGTTTSTTTSTTPATAATAPTQTTAAGAAAAPKVINPAPYVATRFEEASYKQRAEAGNPILLIFSHASDAVWQRQAPVLQGILREPEFGRIAVFQIDIGAYPSVAERFLVSSPGTLLVMKDGFERLRSTRMVKADVIRKMLRLHTAL